MEKMYKISWIKVAGVIAFLVIAIAVIYLVYPKNKQSSDDSNVYINNIALMKEAGFEYFKGSNLPTEIGDSESITLEEMVNSNLIIEFVDENKNTCDETASYVKATKTLDNEYAMKVYLSCDSKSDYIVTSIVENNPIVFVDKDNDVNNDITLDDDTVEVDVKDVSINTDNNDETGTSSKNETITETVTTTKNPTSISQVTNININYINTCKNSCETASCVNSCVNNVYNTVTFDTQGGSYVARQTVKYGGTANYVATYLQGYEFLGWYLNGVKYDFSTPVTSPITLVARWQKIEDTPNEDIKDTFVVRFEPNGGSYVAPQVREEGEKATRPVNPTRACYTFVAWRTESGSIYNFDTKITKDITLYAEWEEDGSCKESYTVTFNSNGGSYVAPQTVEEGSRVTKPANPTRTCYKFVAWHLSKESGSVYNFNSKVTKNITLVAEWEEDGSCKESYTVTFNSNGGSYVASQTVEEGSRATKPTNPTRNGYTFVAWHLNRESGSVYNFSSRVTKNITLVAEWEKDVENYTVTFDSNGGSYVASQTVEEGARAKKPTNPTRKGYTFVAWHLSRESGSVYNFSSRVTKNITLVAEWEKEEQKYHTYCALDIKPFYSISYVYGNNNTWSSSWTIRFDELTDVQDVVINNIEYINTTKMYNRAYNNYDRKTISSVNGNSKYNVAIESGEMLKTYSLKENNFTMSLSKPYYSGGYWYTDVNVKIKNYNNVTKYYASNLGTYVYFIPFYFEAHYTNLNDCVDDLASRSSKYKDYEIIDTYYK